MTQWVQVLNALGFPVTDTNVDGSESAADSQVTGEAWRFLPLS